MTKTTGTVCIGPLGATCTATAGPTTTGTVTVRMGEDGRFHGVSEGQTPVHPQAVAGMGFCTKCACYFSAPGTCNCFAQAALPAPVPYSPYLPPPLFPQWYPYQHPYYRTGDYRTGGTLYVGDPLPPGAASGTTVTWTPT